MLNPCETVDEVIPEPQERLEAANPTEYLRSCEILIPMSLS